MRRLVIAAAVGAAVVGSAVPSLAQSNAQSSSTPPNATVPVGVVYSTDGGVFVGTTFEGRPLAAAQVAGGRACVGVSLEVPFCTPPLTLSDNIPRDVDVAEGGAYASVHTSDGVSVSTGVSGQPLVWASVGNGWACVSFSEEVPFCYPLDSTARAVAGI